MGKNHPQTANIIYELGCFFFVKPEDLGFKSEQSWNIDEAEKWLLKSYDSFKEAVGEDHPDCARVLNRLGSLYIERTDFAKADENLTKALDIRVNKLGLYHSRVAQTYKHTLTLYQLQEKLKEATDRGTKALEIVGLLYGADTIQYALILLRMAEISIKAKKIDISKTLLNDALVIFEKHNHTDHIQSTKQTLASLNAPPPPPPPKFLIPQELAPEATKDMLRQSGRQQLLQDIVNFTQNKALKREEKQSKAKNEDIKQNWWKQNYQGKKVIQDKAKKLVQMVQYDEMEQDDDAYFEEQIVERVMNKKKK